MKCYRLRSKMSRKEAKLVLKYMQEIIDNYGWASLADLYDLIDRKSNYLDNKRRWYSLRGASVSYFRKCGCYEIHLPAFDEDIEVIVELS